MSKPFEKLFEPKVFESNNPDISARPLVSGLRRSGLLLMEIVFSMGLLAILTVYISSHVGQTGVEANRQKNDMHAVVTGNNLIEIMIATSSPPLTVLNALLPPPGLDGKINVTPTSPLWSGGTTTSTVQIVKDVDNPISSFSVLISNLESGIQAGYWHVFVLAGANSPLGGSFNINRPALVQVDASQYHNLVMRGDGTVLGWGLNNSGQALGRATVATVATTPSLVTGPNGTDPLSSVTQVESSSASASFAINSSGQIYAWGENFRGFFGPGLPVSAVQTTPRLVQRASGTPYSGFQKIAVGYGHVVGLKTDGTILSWGSNANGELGNRRAGPTQYPTPVVATMGNQIAGGSQHSAVLKPDGTVWTWGDNSRKQLGYGGSSSVPKQISNFTGVKEIQAGNYFCLALLENGNVNSWGYNNLGQCGIGKYSPAEITNPDTVVGPPSDNPLSGIIAVDAGASHSIALDNQGRVWCWGSNANGRCGIPVSTPSTHTPFLYYDPGLGGLRNPAQAVAAGGGHSLYNRGGVIYGWGASESGQLGAVSPVGAGWVTVGYGHGVTAGASFSMWIDNDGFVFGCGANNRGQLGNNQNTAASYSSTIRVLNSAGSFFTAEFIDAGENWVVAIASGGEIWGWGDNSYGQLGQNPVSLSFSRVPVRIHAPANEGEKPQFVIAGRFHGLAILQNGTVFGWGNNASSQLVGAGTWILPTAISGLTAMFTTLTGIIDIAAGPYHTLALKSDGTTWAWGFNSDGQLGDGNYDSIRNHQPRQVHANSGAGFLSSIAAISASQNSSYALDTTGMIWAWGNGSHGQMGNGASTQYNPRPIRVRDTSNLPNSTLSDVKEVVGTASSAFAIKTNGSLFGWGDNEYSQVKPGAGSTILFPVEITELSPVNKITGSYYHALGIRNSSEVWTWGLDKQGVLGDGLPLDNTATPTKITTP